MGILVLPPSRLCEVIRRSLWISLGLVNFDLYSLKDAIEPDPFDLSLRLIPNLDFLILTMKLQFQ